MKNKSAIIYCCLIMLATISVVVVGTYYNIERVNTQEEYIEKLHQELEKSKKDSVVSKDYKIEKTYKTVSKKPSPKHKKAISTALSKREQEKLFAEINKVYKESVESDIRASHGNLGHDYFKH